MTTIPAISGFDDFGQARPMFFQSGRPVHAPFPTGLADIASLSPADGNFIVGNGTNWVAESGATARASLEITTGTWTPTITNVANVAASTSAVCNYLRAGTAVTCWGVIQIDPTAAAPTATAYRISLPIASNFGAITDCAGTTSTGGNQDGRVTADTANDAALVDFIANSASNAFHGFHFSYRII